MSTKPLANNRFRRQAPNNLIESDLLSSIPAYDPTPLCTTFHDFMSPAELSDFTLLTAGGSAAVRTEDFTSAATGGIVDLDTSTTAFTGSILYGKVAPFRFRLGYEMWFRAKFGMSSGLQAVYYVGLASVTGVTPVISAFQNAVLIGLNNFGPTNTAFDFQARRSNSIVASANSSEIASSGRGREVAFHFDGNRTLTAQITDQDQIVVDRMRLDLPEELWPAANLAPVIHSFTQTSSAKQISVDYMYAAQRRTLL
jgi:hypothetical protein